MRSKESKWRNFFVMMLLLGDALAIGASFCFAYLMRFRVELVHGFAPVTKGVPAFDEYLKAAAVVCLVWIIIFQAFGLYDYRRRFRFVEQMALLLRAAFLGEVVVIAMGSFYRGFSYSRLVVVLAFLFSLVGLILIRYLNRRVRVFFYRRGIGLRRVLVLGAGEVGSLVAERLRSHPDLGYSLLGFLDDKLTKGSRIGGVRVMGKIAEIDKALGGGGVDEVIAALPPRAQHKLFKVASTCDKYYVNIKIIPDIFSICSYRPSVEDLDGLPVIGVRGTPLTGWNLVLKRSFDLALTGVIVIVLSPLLLLIALAIKTGSHGSVFFRQERVGRDGRIFRMLKFRTMIPQAEKSGPRWAKRGDPRCTPLGRTLRRFSLDELPQLINVLRGEMSLVGPRPERPFFVNRFQHQMEKYLTRHYVKAGITGWAQVHGLRGQTSLKRRQTYDMYYCENWTLFLDIKILFMTVVEVVRGRNAY